MRAPTFFDKNFTPFVFVLSAALALAVCGFSLLSIFRVGFEVDEASYLAGSIYLGSHIFRVVRLIALSIDDPRGAYLITPAHLITAPLGFFLPFKLGEVFRVIAIAASFKSLKKGILIWLLERVGDVFVLLLLGILLLLLGRLSGFSASSMLIALTIASTLILLSFWALFDLSSFLIEILVLRSQSKLGFFLLKQTSELRALAVSFRKSLSGRLLTLLVSSIFIWGCEAGALFILAERAEAGEVDLLNFVNGIFSPARETTDAYAAVGGLSQVVLLFAGLITALLFARKFTVARDQD